MRPLAIPTHSLRNLFQKDSLEQRGGCVGKLSEASPLLLTDIG